MRRWNLLVLLMVSALAACAAAHQDEKALLSKRAAEELGDIQFVPGRVWGRGLSYAFVDGTIFGKPIRVRFKKTEKGWRLDDVAQRGIWYDIDRFRDDFRKECLVKTQNALLAWETWFDPRNADARGPARLAAQLDAGACKPATPCPVPRGAGFPPAVDGWDRNLLFFVRDLGVAAASTDGTHTRLLTVFSRGADGIVGSEDDLAKNILLNTPS
jgi:hypothetical protein